MDEASVTQYILDNFDDVKTAVAYGGTFFSYDPEQKFPFATLVNTDENDSYSNLNRPGVYRLNIGVSKATFQALFGAKSTQDDAAEEFDYTVLDQILPHPVYGRMYWVSILNPSPETFDQQIAPLLSEAYELDVAKHSK